MLGVIFLRLDFFSYFKYFYKKYYFSYLINCRIIFVCKERGEILREYILIMRELSHKILWPKIILQKSEA